jgi:hypothetical protein
VKYFLDGILACKIPNGSSGAKQIRQLHNGFLNIQKHIDDPIGGVEHGEEEGEKHPGKLVDKDGSASASLMVGAQAVLGDAGRCCHGHHRLRPWIHLRPRLTPVGQLCQGKKFENISTWCQQKRLTTLFFLVLDLDLRRSLVLRRLVIERKLRFSMDWSESTKSPMMTLINAYSMREKNTKMVHVDMNTSIA